MYSVSPEFLTAMDSPVQEHKVTGTIGSATFGPANILAGSFSINAKLCSEQEIQIGQVYITELSATFRNVSVNPGEWKGKVITPVFSLKTENGWEDVPLGVFTVAEATISASGVSVKAYDNMTKFDKYCTNYRSAGGGSGVEGTVSFVVGRTTYDLLQMICHKCDVVFGMTRIEVAALPNSGNGWDLFSDNDITTYRDMLSWMAQTLACNATINRSGELVLVPFKSASDYTFDDEHRHEGASFKDFTTRITEIWLDCKPMEKSYSYYVNPNNGLSYELGQNPYLQIGTAEDRDDAMNDILTALQAVNYTPFDVNLTGCPIFDLGDVLTFTGGITGGLKKGAVTSFTYTYNAAYKLACGGKNPAEAKAKSATDKRMDGINSSVTAQGKPVMVVRNAESVTLGDGSEVTVIDYPFEVTDSVNLTIVSTEILMTTEATETEAGDVFTIGDIVARAILYLDGIEIGDLYPEFIVDEGTDTINFDYSLKDLTVGAHNYTVKLELNGGDGAVNANDVHESLWGYGITFEVYLKTISVVSMPRTVYYNDDTFSTDGLSVRGVNNNGTTFPISSADIETDPADGDPLTDVSLGEHDCEVSYINGEGQEYETTFPYEIIPYTFEDVFGTWYKNTELGGDPTFWQTNRRKAFGVGISGGMKFAQAESCVIQNGYLQDSYAVGYGNEHTEFFNLSEDPYTVIQGVNAGFVYLVNSNDPSVPDKLYLAECDFESGLISETLIDEIGTVSGQGGVTSDVDYRCMGDYCIARRTSDLTCRVYDLTSGDMILSFREAKGRTDVSSVCLPNGDCYYLIGTTAPSTATISATIVSIIGGVASVNTVSVAGLSDGTNVLRLNYDAAADKLLLHRISGKSGYYDTTTTNLSTHIYELDKATCAISSEISVPSYVLIPTNITATGWTPGTYTKLWLNATTAPRGVNINSGINDTFNSSLDADGYYYTNALAILANEVSFYFDENEKASPPPVMFGRGGYANSQGGWTCLFCIANLYFQQDSSSFVGSSEV